MSQNSYDLNIRKKSYKLKKKYEFFIFIWGFKCAKYLALELCTKKKKTILDIITIHMAILETTLTQAIINTFLGQP